MSARDPRQDPPVQGDLRELYQEVIFDHNRKPRNFRALEPADHVAHGHNPLCGDQLTVYLRVADGVIDGGEERFLADLRHTLALDEADARFARGFAHWTVARALEDASPWHRAFASLVLEGARRLERVRARRGRAAA